MSEQELKDLQIYIGKRNQNQTDEQVIDYIKKNKWWNTINSRRVA